MVMRILGQRSLTHQFFVYMAIIGILPLAVVAVATYYSLSESSLERALADQLNILHSDREQIILIQEQIESLIDNISGVELIRNELEKPFEEVTAFRRLSTEARVGSILNGYLNVKGIVSIHLFGSGGAHFRVGETLDFDDALQSRARNMIGRARASEQRIYWAGIEENINQRSRSEYVLPAIKILYETDRNTLERIEAGVVMVNYSVDYLAERFRGQKTNQSSRELLLDQFRRVVIGTRPRDARLPESEVLRAAFAPGARDDTVEVDGETYYRVYAPIERSDWMLVSITPHETILAGVLQLRNRTLVALALAFAFVIWVSLRFSRSVVAPTEGIARAFSRMNEGRDGAAALPVEGSGEIAELTKLFNRFVEQQSDRERANQAAREAAAVFSVSSEGIMITDTDGVIKLVNPAFERITGYSADQAIGQHMSLIESGAGNVEDRLKISDRLRESGQFEGEVEGRRSNGEIYPEWRTISVVRDRMGEPVEYVTMFADITSRKRAEREQARLQREVSQSHKLQALGQLTGGIAHDFNNILGIIMGYTSLALKKFGDKADPKLSSYLETVMSASERARNLIAQMLTYSRSEASEVRSIQIGPVVEESVNMLRSIIPSSIEVSFSSEENLPEVTMDAVGLQQVVMNLCVNARDAMGGSGRLSLRLGRQRVDDAECAVCHRRVRGDWIELSVADTGSGIEPEVLEHIFEPFFTTKDVGEGVGMGLAVVHGIIQRLHAHVLVDSTLGQGTVFRVLFAPAASSMPDVSMPKVPSAPRRGSGGRVLVVDDEPELAELTAEVLEDHGFACTVCTRSEDALALVAADSGKFDTMVTDQTMPVITGIELVERMRGMACTIPVVLVTGYSELIDAGSAGELGVEFMAKPVDPEQLAARVAAAVDRHRGAVSAGA